RGVVRSIGHTHLSISGRAFKVIGPAATPVQVAHDALTRSVYGIVAGAHAVVPRVGAAAAIQRAQRAEGGTSEQPWTPRSRSARVLGALNGLKGDHVASRYPELGFPMTVRNHIEGGDATLTDEGLAAAYPQPSNKVAVFVHGLCETDRSWWDGAIRHHGEPSVSYGSLLEADLGFTPVYLRYNSGLPIADNGRSLAALLDKVVDAWPVPVQDVVLIGHSLGGLVIRSASHSADLENRRWVRFVRHVICVGTPHLGAPLERGVNRLVPLLARIPETQPLASFLHERAAGVKDLGDGVFTTDEYHGDDPDEYLAHRRTEVPFLTNATYCFVGATVTRDRHHPIGHLVGDLLVRYPSASGSDEHRNIPFELEHGAHVGGVNHFDLLNHPTVYRHLRRWLAHHEGDHYTASV
ncbi:MAG: lipase family alpha/beta hydrolase, partial [Acidimicrobiales bacterium]